MRKVSVLMALLITGYILGIWNFLILPKYFIVFGLKGLVVSLVPVLVAMFLIYSEAESTKRTRYLIYELFFKVARTPAFIFTLLMFLLIMLGLTAYLSSWGLIYIFGWDTSYVTLLAILTLLLTVLLLLLAKGRVLEFISGISVLMIIFTLASAYLVREQALKTVTSEQAKFYMQQAVSAITSFGGNFTVQGLTMLTASVIIAFGLGAGVYYVIGSFSPEDLDFKRVLLGVFFLQLILSFAAAYTMAYSMGPAFQAFEKSVHNINISPEESLKLYTQFQALQSYATNSTTPVQDSIKVFFTIPRILKGVPGATKIIYLLVLSLYFAGLTTLIVLMEMGSQMLSEVMQLGRKSGLTVVTLIAIVIAGAMALQSVRVMFLFVPFSVAALVSALEAYPLFSSELTANKGLVGVSIGFLILVGIGTLYYALLNTSTAAKLGAIIGLVLFVPAFMNSVLLKSRR
ncbi:sodium-dependent transporter [Thermococcus sp.]|uniref:sodium-dependent transporter n=1 Tax=Thermococcus sp. TaxID=35749 RepID=UPI00262C9AC1|nr:sodium-dependent transporter [Thermococcus sp.]